MKLNVTKRFILIKSTIAIRKSGAALSHPPLISLDKVLSMAVRELSDGCGGEDWEVEVNKQFFFSQFL